MAVATLTSKGQVTIPKEIRERLGVDRGDRIEFSTGESGEVVLRAARPKPLPAFVGFLSKYARRPALTVEAMDEAIGRHLAEKFERATRR
jgi:AbrB family looped-hinge helix DNA binding protein